MTSSTHRPERDLQMSEDLENTGLAPLATTWWAAIRRHLVLIGALALVGAVLGAIAAFAMPKTYSAQSELILLPTNGKDATDLNNSTGVAKSMVSSYALAVSSSEVLDAALTQTGRTLTVDQLSRNVQPTVPSGTVIIDIAVKDSSAKGASDLANAISTQFVQRADKLMPSITGGSVVMKPSILRPATPPGGPSSLGLKALVPAGAFIGLACGIALALVRGTRRR